VGFYRDQVVPRITDVVMNSADLRPIRDRVAAGLAGEVLEVGFGSGLNVPHYPRAVARVLAVDPARVGRKLAARRLAVSPVPVEFAGLDGEQLPWPDEHGRSPDPAVARWQDRLTPVQRRLAGGCHLGRPIAQLVAGSGLQIVRMDTYDMQGLKALNYMFEGRAARPTAAAGSPA
jgi:Methyltransferase domain